MLTSASIEKAKARRAEYWLTDNDGTRGGGRLTLRVGPTGSKLWYYRYSVEARRSLLPLLPFSPRPADAHYTLEQARARARQLAELHRRPESRDVAAFLLAQDQARCAAEAERAQGAERARLDREREARYTLKALCDWYVEHLRKAERASWRDVKYIFGRHVDGTALAALPACALTQKQATELIRAVVEAGHGRTAAKLRSSLRAAYALALAAESDAAAPAELADFGIETNPIANTAPLSRFNKARDRALNQLELRALWRRLAGAVAGQGPVPEQALALVLLLGGQRIAQLLRARVGDVNWLAGTITLSDGKGRRQQARKHVLPMVEPVTTLVRALIERAQAAGSQWLFASNQANKTVVPDSVSGACAAIVGGLLRDGSIAAPFQARDLRRTAETCMAALGVSSDVMAQVQSHGLGGVQQRHYNRHDYMAEKERALMTWVGYLQRLGAEPCDDEKRATGDLTAARP